MCPLLAKVVGANFSLSPSRGSSPSIAALLAFVAGFLDPQGHKELVAIARVYAEVRNRVAALLESVRLQQNSFLVVPSGDGSIFTSNK